MRRASNFIQVTPFLHVGNLDAALGFFTGILGFDVRFRLTDYAYVEREGVGFRILAHEEGVAAGERSFAYYIDVRDVDALYLELKPALQSLPEGDVHGPADKPYGQRELLIAAPDGRLIAFGQAIGTDEARALRATARRKAGRSGA